MKTDKRIIKGVKQVRVILGGNISITSLNIWILHYIIYIKIYYLLWWGVSVCMVEPSKVTLQQQLKECTVLSSMYTVLVSHVIYFYKDDEYASLPAKTEQVWHWYVAKSWQPPEKRCEKNISVCFTTTTKNKQLLYIHRTTHVPEVLTLATVLGGKWQKWVHQV